MISSTWSWLGLSLERDRGKLRDKNLHCTSSGLYSKIVSSPLIPWCMEPRWRITLLETVIRKFDDRFDCLNASPGVNEPLDLCSLSEKIDYIKSSNQYLAIPSDRRRDQTLQDPAKKSVTGTYESHQDDVLTNRQNAKSSHHCEPFLTLAVMVLWRTRRRFYIFSSHTWLM